MTGKDTSNPKIILQQRKKKKKKGQRKQGKRKKKKELEKGREWATNQAKRET